MSPYMAACIAANKWELLNSINRLDRLRVCTHPQEHQRKIYLHDCVSPAGKYNYCTVCTGVERRPVEEPGVYSIAGPIIPR